MNNHSNIRIINTTGINYDTKVLIDGVQAQGITGLTIDFGVPGEGQVVTATITAYVQNIDVVAESINYT